MSLIQEPPPQDPPPATSPSVFAAHVGDDGKFKPDFLEAVPETLRPTFGKYQTPADLLKGIENLVHLAGKKADGLKVPGDDALPEEIAAFNRALGVPDAPEGYGIKKPEALPDGVQWDDEAMAEYSKAMHGAGIPAKAAQKLLEAHVGIVAKQAQAMETKAKEDADAWIGQQKEALRKEWGADMAGGMEKARKGAAALGIPLDHPALNDASVVLAMAKAAGFVQEDKLHAGKPSAGFATADDEAKDIQTNPNNPLHARYVKGDPEAAARVRQLLSSGN